MIDAIVKAIRASTDRAAARDALMGKRFGFSEIQANHILDMALGRLDAARPRRARERERRSSTATVKELQRILAKRDVLMGVIREELTAIRDAHKAPRRAEIVADDTGHDRRGRAGRGRAVRRDRDRARLRARRARAGREARRSAPASATRSCRSSRRPRSAGVLFFTNRGRAYRATVHELPKERLTAAQNLFQFADGERVIAVLDARQVPKHPNLVFVTANGRGETIAARRVRRSFGPQGRHRRDEAGRRRRSRQRVPRLGRVRAVARHGAAARASGSREEEVRPVGRSAGSIRGIKLKGDDRVVGGCAVAHEEIVVIATDAGYAKRTPVDEFPVQARGGSGVEGGQDRQGTRSRGGRHPRRRGGGVRHHRRRGHGAVGVRCAKRRATAADPRSAASSGQLLRVVAVSEPPEPS